MVVARFTWLLAAFFVVLAAACTNDQPAATPTPGAPVRIGHAQRYTN
jgi:hypothetical protein